MKVRCAWAYLYRALDKLGDTIDFFLPPTRTAKAAKRFLAKARKGLKPWERPEVINSDRASTYAVAITELKAEGKRPQDTQHLALAFERYLHMVDFHKPPFRHRQKSRRTAAR